MGLLLGGLCFAFVAWFFSIVFGLGGQPTASMFTFILGGISLVIAAFSNLILLAILSRITAAQYRARIFWYLLL